MGGASRVGGKEVPTLGAASGNREKSSEDASMGASQLVEAELLLTLRLDALSALSALPEISLDKEFWCRPHPVERRPKRRLLIGPAVWPCYRSLSGDRRAMCPCRARALSGRGALPLRSSQWPEPSLISSRNVKKHSDSFSASLSSVICDTACGVAQSFSLANDARREISGRSLAEAQMTEPRWV